MQSGANDAMVLETTKQRYKNRTGAEFKHQPKWRARSAATSTTDPFLYLSDATTEEEVTRPISRDRAKTTVQRGKGRKD
jgi:hypothetical protein